MQLTFDLGRGNLNASVVSIMWTMRQVNIVKLTRHSLWSADVLWGRLNGTLLAVVSKYYCNVALNDFSWWCINTYSIIYCIAVGDLGGKRHCNICPCQYAPLLMTCHSGKTLQLNSRSWDKDIFASDSETETISPYLSDYHCNSVTVMRIVRVFHDIMPYDCAFNHCLWLWATFMIMSKQHWTAVWYKMQWMDWNAMRRHLIAWPRNLHMN